MANEHAPAGGRRRRARSAGRAAATGGRVAAARPGPERPGSRQGGPTLSHVDAAGRIRMVDVSEKPVTARDAVARGRITMSRAARLAIRAGRVKKGDPLQTARLAGIMAAKRTADLIPLCHSLNLSHADVSIVPEADGYAIEARVRTASQTGVEMEALTAVSVAALTVYDMLKAVDKAMVIGEIRLVEKRGGRSGDYQA
jgi:cyclic pyranopterin phosphate synthase